MLKQRILHKAPARRTPGYFWTLSEKISIPELREKLQDTEALGWQIRTVWGVGYKFEVK